PRSPRVVQQQLVELPPQDVEGEVALVVDDPGEAPRGLGPPVGVHEPDPRLADEPPGHLVQDAQLAEDRVAEREEGLAHVVPGDPPALQAHHPPPPPGQERGDRRPGRPAPHDEDVGPADAHTWARSRWKWSTKALAVRSPSRPCHMWFGLRSTSP